MKGRSEFMLMRMRHASVAARLVIIGSAFFSLGIFLLLVKLVILLAWFAAGIIALVGLVLMLIGFFLGKRRRIVGRDEAQRSPGIWT